MTQLIGPIKITKKITWQTYTVKSAVVERLGCLRADCTTTKVNAGGLT